MNTSRWLIMMCSSVFFLILQVVIIKKVLVHYDVFFVILVKIARNKHKENIVIFVTMSFLVFLLSLHEVYAKKI